ASPGGFDGPGAGGERFGEVQEAVALAAIRNHPQLTDQAFLPVQHRRSMRPLVRVDPDHEHDVLLKVRAAVDATAGSPDEGSIARLFRATPQREPGGRSLRSEANRVGGRAFSRPPARPSDATSELVAPAAHSPSGQSVRTVITLGQGDEVATLGAAVVPDQEDPYAGGSLDVA